MRHFTFLESFMDAVDNLPEDVQLDVLRAICRYGTKDEEPGPGTIAAGILAAIKPAIDAGKMADADRREKARAAAEARWKKDADACSSNANACERIPEQCSTMPKEKKRKEKERKEKELLSSAASVLDALNREAGRKFKPTEGTLKPIVARLREGRTVEECLEIIRKMVKAWKDDRKMSAYLRPETLFSPGHFDSYLNAPEPESIDRSERPPNRFHNFEERKTDYDAMLGVI